MVLLTLELESVAIHVPHGFTHKYNSQKIRINNWVAQIIQKLRQHWKFKVVFILKGGEIFIKQLMDFAESCEVIFLKVTTEQDTIRER